jgi:plastocyanin
VKKCGIIGFTLAGLLLFGAASGFGQASVEGRVSLPKPEAKGFIPPHYPGQVAEVAPPDPPVAVVYLEGKFPAGLTNSAPSTNVVSQSGAQFRPGLLPVRVGTPVSFPNEDDFYHNVFSYSKTKRFDLGRYRKTDRPSPVEVFDKPGVVKLYCEIHQHMRGIILVLDSPFFTRTDTNGWYSMHDLPTGDYVLKAWLDEKHVYEKPVELKPGEVLHIDFGNN